MLLAHDDACRCSLSTGFLEDRGDGVAERPVCLVVRRHCEHNGYIQMRSRSRLDRRRGSRTIASKHPIERLAWSIVSAPA